jgi:hypothetical protein
MSLKTNFNVKNFEFFPGAQLPKPEQEGILPLPHPPLPHLDPNHKNPLTAVANYKLKQTIKLLKIKGVVNLILI